MRSRWAEATESLRNGPMGRRAALLTGGAVRPIQGDMNHKDGQSPDPYSPPSWRGTLVMLLVIVVVLGLIAYAFFSIMSQPGAPDLQIPGSLPR
jgi:hypothetical protein